MNALLQANLFSFFPSWKSIEYRGEVTPKVLRFEVVEGEENRPLYLAVLISREEKMAWQSFLDVMDHTMVLAQAGLRGFFGLDVLSVDIRAGLQQFNLADFARMIVNHSKTLGPDGKVLIRYGQLFTLLHYRAPAEWGKIEVKTHAEFFSQGSASGEVSEASVRAALMGVGSKNKKSASDQLDLFLKKLLRDSGQESRAIYLVHDLSAQPLWDSAHELQSERVRAWLEKEKQSRQGTLPEIHFYHSATRTHGLLS